MNKPLYRAYLLKEQLRVAVQLKGEAGQALLGKWCAWAARCRLPSFTRLAKRIRAHRAAIDATFKHGLSNARVEGLNTRLRIVSRMAYGFHSAAAVISPRHAEARRALSRPPRPRVGRQAIGGRAIARPSAQPSSRARSVKVRPRRSSACSRSAVACLLRVPPGASGRSLTLLHAAPAERGPRVCSAQSETHDNVRRSTFHRGAQCLYTAIGRSRRGGS